MLSVLLFGLVASSALVIGAVAGAVYCAEAFGPSVRLHITCSEPKTEHLACLVTALPQEAPKNAHTFLTRR